MNQHIPAQASANCYLDKHIASTSSESKKDCKFSGYEEDDVINER